MIDVQKLWQETVEKFKNEPEKEILMQFADCISGIHKFVNGYIYLIIDTDLNKFRLIKFYLKKFNDILKTLTTENVSYEVITVDEVKKENEKISQLKKNTNQEPSQIQNRMLRPEYTFENFVTGEANREAFTFAVKVAENPNVTINPFYIFGDVGLGKTHLMNAIGHYILHKDINNRVIYITAQQFIEDFFKAKNRNQKNTALAEDFDNFYRQADVLLVDDIQFLENKQGSQEEFFKIFEELFSRDKQIIVTSDRPASELNIMARLKSRFSWGMQTNLKKPNLELRKNIAKDKLKFLIDDPNSVPEDVINFVCENFDENVRELEGALRRLISYCVSFNYDFTLENAKIALEAILKSDKPKEQEKNSNRFEALKEAVTRYFNINTKDLISTSRKKNLVYARSLAIFIAKSKLDISFNQLGEALGHRDHATIMHAYQKMCELVNSDEMVRTDANNIIKIIEKL